MRITDNTILITGGGSGIGFEIAKQFSELGNRVILVGRDAAKLSDACRLIRGSEYLCCDITDESAVRGFSEKVRNEYPSLNVLINNAGRAYGYGLLSGNAFDKAREEITTNYLAALRLVDLFLPLLKEQKEAAIVNNSSLTSLVPVVVLPTYSASKAALHSYTCSLRWLLQRSTNVKVFELMPPLVDTAFSKGLPGKKIPAVTVAEQLITGMRNDDYEIHVGATADIYKLYLQSPSNAMQVVNGGS